MNWQSEIKEIEDSLFPHFECNIWERGLYYYLIRRTRLNGTDEHTIPLSEMSAALRCSDFRSRKTIRSLAEKGCIEFRQTRGGHCVRVHLPNDLDLPVASSEEKSVDIENVDFYANRDYVDALITRETGRCFYCLREITKESCELDHIISQLHRGGNGYRNIVASCHECNTKKQGADPTDYLRQLYRKGLLTETEFDDRQGTLRSMQAGELKPII